MVRRLCPPSLTQSVKEEGENGEKSALPHWHSVWKKRVRMVRRLCPPSLTQCVKEEGENGETSLPSLTDTVCNKGEWEWWDISALPHWHSVWKRRVRMVRISLCPPLLTAFERGEWEWWLACTLVPFSLTMEQMMEEEHENGDYSFLCPIWKQGFYFLFIVGFIVFCVSCLKVMFWWWFWMGFSILCELPEGDVVLNGFQLENLFCLGSPLAVFLALRGIRPQGTGSTEHFLPAGTCKRLFNIYHPSDPVVCCSFHLVRLVVKRNVWLEMWLRDFNFYSWYDDFNNIILSE